MRRKRHGRAKRAPVLKALYPMKLVLILLILGILEVVTIGKVHEALDTKGLVILYVVSTLIGMFIAWVYYSDFKLKKGNLNLSNRMGERLKGGKLSEKDIKEIRLGSYCIMYVLACALIAIPGILSDLVGIALLFPFVRNQISSRMYKKNNERYYGNNSESI